MLHITYNIYEFSVLVMKLSKTTVCLHWGNDGIAERAVIVIAIIIAIIIKRLVLTIVFFIT